MELNLSHWKGGIDWHSYLHADISKYVLLMNRNQFLNNARIETLRTALSAVCNSEQFCFHKQKQLHCLFKSNTSAVICLLCRIVICYHASAFKALHFHSNTLMSCVLRGKPFDSGPVELGIFPSQRDFSVFVWSKGCWTRGFLCHNALNFYTQLGRSIQTFRSDLISE